MDFHRIARRVSGLTEKEPEAPDWAPFGKWAWAPEREGMPEEPNTIVENQVYQDIKKHFSNKRVGLPAITASFLRLMLSIGWYKPVLHPPPIQRLYRGIKLRGLEQTAEFFGLDSKNLPEKGKLQLETPRSFPVLNGHSTSWSAKKIITRDFSERGERGWSVTLVAETADNPYSFLAGPGGLYDVEGLSMYHLEKETVGLEPILVRRVEWARL